MSDAPLPHPALDAAHVPGPQAALPGPAPDFPEDDAFDTTFPLDAFPEPLRAWIDATASVTHVGVDAIALPFLALTGAVIGVSLALQVAPGWVERPALWVALVGNTGTGKSPAIAAVRQPIDALQERAWDELRAHLRANRHRPEDPAEALAVDRLVTETTGIDALFDELWHSYGLLIARDELIGLLRAMESSRGRRGDARQKYLTLWSHAPLSPSRPRPEHSLILSPVVGILGGIQPGVYARLRWRDNDGFLERFLPVVLAGSTPYWREPVITSAPDDTSAPLRAITDRLAAIREIGPGPEGDGNIVHRDPAARAVWASWYNDNVDRLHAAPDLTAGVYRKLPAHTARIAIVLHALHYPDDAHERPLGGDVMHDATRLVERFRSHIHRVVPHLDTRLAPVTPAPRPTLPQRVHRLLAETDAPDGWVSRTDIWERLHRPDRDELTAALESLVTGRIAVARTITRPGSCKPTRQWRLVP